MYKVYVTLFDGIGYVSELCGKYQDIDEAYERCYELQSMGYNASVSIR